ncbi:MAG: hypothetical protein ACLFP4_01275 [Spirochaetales bacterium]
MSRRPLLIILFFLQLSSVAAQSTIPFEEEAPEALLEFELADNEVELFMLGNWTTTSQIARSWVFPGSDVVAPQGAVFPGLRSTIPLMNEVNLTLSLWLLRRYFFETTVSDQFENSTILFGYIGMPGELVESVLIGNTAIGMGSYPYLGFGDDEGSIGIDSPGAAISLATEQSYHEMMIRLTPSTQEEVTYTGGGVVAETRLPASGYVRNRFFVLPDGGIDAIDAYVESSSGTLAGDGRRYELLVPGDEYSFSLSRGTISFPEELERRVLVYYEVGGVPVGSPTLGRNSFFGFSDGQPDETLLRDFSFGGAELDDYLATISPTPVADGLGIDDVRVTVHGDDAFVLHEPARYSPFELANRYEFAREQDDVAIVAASGSPVTTTLRSIPEPFAATTALTPNASDPREFANRYPFASSAVPLPQPQIYGRAPSGASELFVVGRTSQPSETITLPRGAIPGSISVTRNGRNDAEFTLTDSGELILADDLSPADTVIVRYREQSASGASDLIFGAGNRFSPIPGTEFTASLGARWTPGRGTFSYEPNEYPGYVVASGSAGIDSTAWEQFQAGELEAEVKGAVSFSTNDTTGVLRLESMDERIEVLSVSPYQLTPAAPPTIDPDTGDGFDVGAAQRGILLYKHFYEEDFLGNTTLLPYDSSSSVIETSDYAPGGRTGPYPALSTDSAYGGNVAVLEYELPSNATWVGAQVDLGEARDYADVSQIVVPYRLVEASDTIRAFLQIGAIGEDIDGDDVLDRGTLGIPFSDARTGFALLAGTKNDPSANYSEDRNLNGVIDRELPERIVTRELPVTAGGWQSATITLTQEESQRLASSRAIRVLLVRTGVGPTSGRFLLGDAEVLGAPLRIEPRSTTGAENISLYAEPSSRLSPPSLGSQFPELGERLERAEGEERHLRLNWDSLATGELALTFPTAVAERNYQSLRVYIRDLNGTSPTITLRALDGETAIGQSSLNLPNSDWAELRLALDDSDRTVTRVEVVVTGTSAGSIAVDEISFWEPRATVGGVAEARARWKTPVELRVGETVVLRDLIVTQSVTAQSRGFAPGLAAAGPGLASSSRVESELFGGGVGIELDLVSRPDGDGGTIGHQLTRSFAGSVVMLADSYERSFGVLDGFQHVASIDITTGDDAQVKAEAEWSVRQDADQLVRWWIANQMGGAELRGTLAVELTETQLAEEPESHVGGWFGSFADLVPDGTASARTIEANASLVRSEAPLAGTATLDASAIESNDILQRRSTLDYGLEVPLTAIERVLIELRFGRSAVWGTARETEAYPWSSVASTGIDWTSHPFAFVAIPGYELLDDRLEQQFRKLSSGLDYARYVPETGVAFSRGIESSPWSLILPVAIEVVAARPITREFDAVASKRTLDLSGQFIAPNLFGRLGSSPLFSFYDTDEYQTRVTARFERSEARGLQTTMKVDQKTELFWGTTRSASAVTELSLTENDSWDWELTTLLSYEWQAGYAGLESRFLPPSGTFAHTESAEIRVERTQRRQTSVLLRHDTAATIGENGVLSLFAGVGLARVSEPGDYWMLGAEAGLELALTY